MQLVIKYATPHGNESETVRTLTLPIGKRMTRGTWNWNEFVTMAITHKRDDERIVAIIEEGYENSS